VFLRQKKRLSAIFIAKVLNGLMGKWFKKATPPDGHPSKGGELLVFIGVLEVFWFWNDWNFVENYGNLGTLNANLETLNANLGTLNVNLATLNVNLGTLNLNLATLNVNLETLNLNLETLNL